MHRPPAADDEREQQAIDEDRGGGDEAERKQRPDLAQIAVVPMGPRPGRQGMIGKRDAEEAAGIGETLPRKRAHRGGESNRQRGDDERRGRDEPVALAEVPDMTAAAQGPGETDGPM